MLRLPAFAAALVLAAGPAAACLVCFELPERTIADRVIEAETVVLAREDMDRPFSYAPIAMLKGTSEDLPDSLLVDSATRRRLAADPGAAVLIARDAEGWSRLADADAEVRAMILAVLAAAPEWEAEADHAARFAFFAERHDHSNSTIRELALAEISRAPYAQIRTMIPRLGRAQILSVLRDPKWADWTPIHILFLGLSRDPDDHAFVRRAFDPATTRGGPQLAAWAVALAEVDGPSAIERLRARYFDDPARDPEHLRAIVTAFATLAQGGDAALRPGIDAAFRGLAAGPPGLAGEAAQQLTFIEDFSQADAFADLLASGAVRDPAAEFVITLYVAAAREAHSAKTERTRRCIASSDSSSPLP